jgi:hypothetical protein
MFSMGVAKYRPHRPCGLPIGLLAGDNVAGRRP